MMQKLASNVSLLETDSVNKVFYVIIIICLFLLILQNCKTPYVPHAKSICCPIKQKICTHGVQSFEIWLGIGL